MAIWISVNITNPNDVKTLFSFFLSEDDFTGSFIVPASKEINPFLSDGI